MNAYKLAKAQQAYSPPTLEEIIKQQADRIAELEKQGEPVAWMNGNEICPEIGYETTITAEHPKNLGWIPLYTHPVKELTDELFDKIFADGKRLGVLETENKFKSPPCAWMVKTNDGKKLMLYGEEQPPKFADEVQTIPLYTTPQTKPLSDEEIIKIRQATKAKSTENWADTLAFARAIEEAHGIK